MPGNEMPFTGHDIGSLQQILESIYKCPMPIEVFDAFLAEYAKSKDLDKARGFAFSEWDC
jgi:hypothetical protein